MMRVIVLPLACICFGCAASPQASRLIGECKSLLVSSDLWESDSGGNYSGRYFIAPKGRKSIQALGRGQKRVAEIGPGTKIEVSNIFKYSGWAESSLRVEVRILEGSYSGTVADIPTYTPYHPSPPWVEEYTMNPDDLTLKKSIFGECH